MVAEDDTPCATCLESKSDHLPSKEKAPVGKVPGELVVFDMWSVSVPFVHGGQCYVIAFHDTCSRITRPYLIGSKSEAARALKEFHAWAKSEGVEVRKYWTDNAPEFCGRQGDTCRNAALSLGAHFGTIAPHVPRQNGTMERQWRTHCNDTIVGLNRAKLPKSYWWYFFLDSCHKRACMPWPDEPDMCAFKRWSGRAPRVTHLRACGCICYPKLVKPKSKIHEKSTPCIHLGRRA